MRGHLSTFVTLRNTGNNPHVKAVSLLVVTVA